MKIPIPWLSISVLVVVGAAMGLAFNALRPDPLPWVAQAKATVNLADLAAPEARQSPMTAADPDPSSTAPSAGDPPPNAIPVPPATETSPPVEQDLYSEIPEALLPISVSLEEARRFYDRRGLLVLDARDMEEYGEGHILGAEAAPYDDKVGDSDWMEKTAGDPRPILVYCTGGECELSHDLAEELLRTGHRRVMIMMEGYAEWKDAGYPTAAGVTP